MMKMESYENRDSVKTVLEFIRDRGQGATKKVLLSERMLPKYDGVSYSDIVRNLGTDVTDAITQAKASGFLEESVRSRVGKKGEIIIRNYSLTALGRARLNIVSPDPYEQFEKQTPPEELEPVYDIEKREEARKVDDILSLGPREETRKLLKEALKGLE
jgi:hypothetical protein